MKEITIRIPENKLGFVIELLGNLGIEIKGKTEIFEAHKEEVRKRIEASTPDNVLPWDDVNGNFQ